MNGHRNDLLSGFTHEFIAFTKTNSKGKPNNKLKRYHEAKFVAKFLGTVVVHCWAITGQNEAGEPENPDPDLYKGP